MLILRYRLRDVVSGLSDARLSSGSGFVGAWTGSLEAPAGIIGTLLGGFAADRLGQRDARWYLWTPVIAVAIMIPSILLFLTVGGSLVFVFYFIAMLAAAS